MRLTTFTLVMAMVVGLAGGRAVVLAHARIQSADPRPGSTVAKAPTMVKIIFTLAPDESLDPKTSTISVIDSHGRRVDDGKGGVDLNDMDRKTMTAMLKAITSGTYIVRWKAVSSPDNDVAQGSFKFTVAASMSSTRMTDTSLPSLRIVSPVPGATVASPIVVVFETTADLSKMTVGEMTKMPGPHLHADLDKRVVMPEMKQIKLLGAHRYQLGLGRAAAGSHTIRLYWGDNKTHKPMGMVQMITVTVR